MLRRPPASAFVATAVVTAGLLAGATAARRQTLAPHELGNSDAPPPIIWATPEIAGRSFDFESAEERKLRVVVVAKHLEQPSSSRMRPTPRPRE